jgi:hypothetical protein
LFGLVFRLESTAPSVDPTGEYTLTVIADSSCTAFPDDAGRRTYKLTIGRHPRSPLPLLYQGTLSGATFYQSNEFRFDIGVSDSVARLLIGEYGQGFTEKLESGYAEIWAGVDASMNGPSSSGSFVGAFTYCGGSVLGPAGIYWSCSVRPVYCEALNHRFTLTRR